MKKLQERSEIDIKDCWDLSIIIKNKKTYEELQEIVKKNSEKIASMKGHILDSADTLLEFLKLNEEECRAFDRLKIYTKFWVDEDTRKNESKEAYLRVRSLAREVNEKESFVLSEFMKKNLSDVQKMMEEQKELQMYDYYFKELYKNKERTLSEKEEEIITKAMNAFGTPDDAFSALDVTDALFGNIMVDDKEVELTHYNYAELLEHKSQKVRKDTFKTFYEFYKNHKNTFASLLKGNYEELEFIRSIRKYDTALEMALDEIHVPKTVYTNLIDAVHKYMNINVNFQKLKAKMLKNKEYHLYDTYVPVVETPQEKYTKEEAIKLVTDALNVLGEDYINHFLGVLNGHTVDFYPNVGKENGAYQWGCYDSPSYVLLNFNGTLNSVSTLAHELGHAVHSMYSKENNPYIYAGYEIFLAEIASTVNEMILSSYLLEHATKKEEKIYYLCEFLDKVKGTIYRQTMFSEFERIMSEKCQNHESLTEENFSDTYYKLNEEYFEDSVMIDEEIRYEGYRISHFYRPFYVYQYATGLISAICIVSDILEGKENIKEKYIEFLKSGSSKDVLEILKIVDVDLTKESTYDKAFTLIKKRYEELKTLVGE